MTPPQPPQRVRIEATGRTWTFEPGQPVRIGRADEMEVVLDHPGVSRLHATLQYGAAGWELRDAGGRNGTWAGGDRVTQLRLTEAQTVNFGGPGHGVDAWVTVEEIADRPTEQHTIPQSPSPAQQETAVYHVQTAAPTGHGLLIKTNDADRRFPPGQPVRIGRDPNSDFVLDDSVVSRVHATVEPRPDGWWFVNHAQGGSFVGGEAVTERKISEPVEIALGHPTAGCEVEVIPILPTAEAQRGIAQRAGEQRRSRRAMVAVAFAAVLILVAGGIGVAVWLGRDEPEFDYAGALELAKDATVQILAVDEDDDALWRGSGSIISEDGLVLTNAHVADPDAPGSDEPRDDPAGYLIALPAADDTPAEPIYRAETIVSDGYLDLAVMQITGRIDGDRFDAEQLPTPIPLGDSTTLSTGDEITALGYPSLSDRDQSTPEGPLTVTKGVVSSFQDDPVTETPRFFIDSDVRIGSGNSGGPSINAMGEVVGINTAGISESIAREELGLFTGGSALIRPIEQAEEVIRIGRDGGDPNYTSPLLEDLPQQDQDMGTVSLEARGWSESDDTECEDGQSTLTGIRPGQTIYAQVVVEGAPLGTPVAFLIVNTDTDTVLDEGSGEWPEGSDATCLAFPLEVTPTTRNVSFLFGVGPDREVTVENPVRLR